MAESIKKTTTTINKVVDIPLTAIKTKLNIDQKAVGVSASIEGNTLTISFQSKTTE